MITKYVVGLYSFCIAVRGLLCVNTYYRKFKDNYEQMIVRECPHVAAIIIYLCRPHPLCFLNVIDNLTWSKWLTAWKARARSSL